MHCQLHACSIASAALAVLVLPGVRKTMNKRGTPAIIRARLLSTLTHPAAAYRGGAAAAPRLPPNMLEKPLENWLAMMEVIPWEMAFFASARARRGGLQLLRVPAPRRRAPAPRGCGWPRPGPPCSGK